MLSNGIKQTGRTLGMLIDVTMPERDASTGGKPPLDGLALYTNGSKKDEGISAEIFAIKKATEMLRGLCYRMTEPVSTVCRSLNPSSQVSLKREPFLAARLEKETLFSFELWGGKRKT